VTSPSLTSTVRAVPTGLISVLVLIGIFGIIEASDAARKAENFANIVRACSRAELALAFAALAPGTNTLISTSLFLVIVSTIARTIAVAEPTNWCGRLGLGSLAGFPPLTGFLGRWFLVTGALMAGSWPLGIGIAIGIFASSLGLWRGMARLKVGRPVLDQTTPTVGTLLLTGIVIGTALIPSRWLLNALLPTAALPGQPGPAPTVAILILGLVLVLVPVLAAAALVRYPEHVRRSMIRSRMVRPSASSLFAPAGALADLAVQFEDRYGLATGVLIAVGTILALVT
ncbi:MAG TPA: hypothetical protein VKX96_14960, partial [Chloroflexota bacterium]|nr:hypothetical protein [Chloroflexota bacterium]